MTARDEMLYAIGAFIRGALLGAFLGGWYVLTIEEYAKSKVRKRG